MLENFDPTALLTDYLIPWGINIGMALRGAPDSGENFQRGRADSG